MAIIFIRPLSISPLKSVCGLDAIDRTIASGAFEGQTIDEHRNARPDLAQLDRVHARSNLAADRFGSHAVGGEHFRAGPPAWRRVAAHRRHDENLGAGGADPRNRRSNDLVDAIDAAAARGQADPRPGQDRGADRLERLRHCRCDVGHFGRIHSMRTSAQRGKLPRMNSANGSPARGATPRLSRRGRRIGERLGLDHGMRGLLAVHRRNSPPGTSRARPDHYHARRGLRRAVDDASTLHRPASGPLRGVGARQVDGMYGREADAPPHPPHRTSNPARHDGRSERRRPRPAGPCWPKCKSDRPPATRDAIERFERLVEIVEALGSCVLALSGGIDSSFCSPSRRRSWASAAWPSPATRPRCRPGIEPTPPSPPGGEPPRDQMRTIPTKELDDSRYARNPRSRCYFCKLEVYGAAAAIARAEGYAWVVDGTTRRIRSGTTAPA